MSEQEPEKLEHLLKQWADEQEPTDAEMERLRGRVVLACYQDEEVERVEKKEQTSELAWETVLSLAVALLVAIGAAFILNPR